MFDKEIYAARRKALVERMQRQGAGGIAVFLGNVDAAMNYQSNSFPFRQDSTFAYFWGLQESGLAATLNLENGRECIYGDDVDLDDIIWMGPQKSIRDKAEEAGVGKTAPMKDFSLAVGYALDNEVPVHFLPSGRYYNRLLMSQLTGTPADIVYKTAPYDKEDYVHSSEELTKAVVDLRLVKKEEEIAEIDKACDLGVLMHTVGRKACKAGAAERDIAGAMDAFAATKGWGISFPTILSQRGEILHGHSHNLTVSDGRLLLIDAGLALDSLYCSDFTRTLPCSGKFTTQQKEIYDIVEGCNALAAQIAAPGVQYRDVHIAVCELMLKGLAEIGLVSGDPAEMNAEGIAGMFMPHGLGHNMGLDVHDMEDLGENYVGYDEDQTRSSQLGLGSLRMARRLVPGHVITDEPGIYFIPDLIELWKKEGTDKGHVNYDRMKEYYDFGGIRLEDDVLVTPDGARRLGSSRLPISPDDVEEAMKND